MFLSNTISTESAAVEIPRWPRKVIPIFKGGKYSSTQRLVLFYKAGFGILLFAGTLLLVFGLLFGRPVGSGRADTIPGISAGDIYVNPSQPQPAPQPTSGQGPGARDATASAASKSPAGITEPTSATGPTGRSKVDVVGSFDNLRYTAEHTYGYVVDLWREGNRVLGQLEITYGRQADFTTVPIDNGTIDDATHRLTFQATAPSGVSFRFVGTISASRIRGVLTRNDGTGRRSATSDSESVQLRSTAQGKELMHGYATYEEWKADVITRFERAPR